MARHGQERDFSSTEAVAGVALMGAAGLALIVANSPLGPIYQATLATHVGPLSIRHWIDDGLMALFFLVVGLEVKRELIEGELSDPRARALPVIAAIAGMIVPALIYILIARGEPGALRGWAIPAATDIAFAQGLLALAGRGTPPALRLFLTSVAIADDIGAVAIIALAYTPSIDLVMLAAAAAIVGVMAWLNRRGVDRLWPYLLLAALLWVATYRSGVHATVAGVLAAFVIPIRAGRAGGTPPLHRLEHALHPIVAFGIVPLFAFANAGLPLAGIGPAALLAPIPLGLMLALFLGKQVGVVGGVALAMRSGLARLPDGIRPLQLYGVALLCGIGFTMSLFIGGLAFADAATQDAVRLGVLAGSLLSALAGLAILRASRSAPGRS